MPKLKAPLFSLDAHKTIGKFLTFVTRRHVHIAERTPVVPDAKTLAQLSWRHMFMKVVALWHALTPAEQADWESLARRHHLTGYQWFVSQALKPNPGIYLPLQGGTMQGDIDMAKYRIIRLPLPTDDQHPVTLKYFNDNLPVGGYTEGARVYHNTNQNVANNAWTALAFNSEVYDTDTIHDPATNNSRLTCKTAGVYIITGDVDYDNNSFVGHLVIRLNGTLHIGGNTRDTGIQYGIAMSNVTTNYHLNVNDYVELLVYQGSGVARPVVYINNRSPVFMMQRIG